MAPLAYLLFSLGFMDAVEIIGKRFSLRKMEMAALSKLVRPPDESLRNSLKVAPASCASGRDLGVDGFNVLITLEAALNGEPVYMCSDGMVRDLSLAYSSYRPSEYFEDAVKLLSGTIKDLKPKKATIYLDSPISKSGKIAERMRDLLGTLAEVRVSKMVDSEVLGHEVVASSDSRVISHASCIIDIPRIALEGMGLRPKPLFLPAELISGLLIDRPAENG